MEGTAKSSNHHHPSQGVGSVLYLARTVYCMAEQVVAVDIGSLDSKSAELTSLYREAGKMLEDG